MTPQEIQDMVRSELLNLLGDYSKIPLEVRNALAEAGFLYVAGLSDGFLTISGGKIVSKALGSTGTRYTSSSSGGPVTTPITITDGLITAIT